VKLCNKEGDLATDNVGRGEELFQALLSFQDKSWERKKKVGGEAYWGLQRILFATVGFRSGEKGGFYVTEKEWDIGPIRVLFDFLAKKDCVLALFSEEEKDVGMAMEIITSWS